MNISKGVALANPTDQGVSYFARTRARSRPINTLAAAPTSSRLQAGARALGTVLDVAVVGMTDVILLPPRILFGTAPTSLAGRCAYEPIDAQHAKFTYFLRETGLIQGCLIGIELAIIRPAVKILAAIAAIGFAIAGACVGVLIGLSQLGRSGSRGMQMGDAIGTGAKAGLEVCNALVAKPCGVLLGLALVSCQATGLALQLGQTAVTTPTFLLRVLIS